VGVSEGSRKGVPTGDKFLMVPVETPEEEGQNTLRNHRCRPHPTIRRGPVVNVSKRRLIRAVDKGR
jgi:hypothetical protein